MGERSGAVCSGERAEQLVLGVDEPQVGADGVAGPQRDQLGRVVAEGVVGAVAYRFALAGVDGAVGEDGQGVDRLGVDQERDEVIEGARPFDQDGVRPDPFDQRPDVGGTGGTVVPDRKPHQIVAEQRRGIGPPGRRIDRGQIEAGHTVDLRVPLGPSRGPSTLRRCAA